MITKPLESESTALFLDDESFYHTCIPLSSITISVKIAIKGKSRAHITASIIKGAANKYSLIWIKIVKSSYLTGSFDQNNKYLPATFLLPIYWILLPLSYFTCTNPAVKHKKP